MQEITPEMRELIESSPLPPLGSGEVSPGSHSRINALLAQIPSQNMAMNQACISGIWLLYGFLDESHNISQNITSSTGSFWHGIMHRREPDAGNAAYWFDKVGKHPVFPAIATAITPLINKAPCPQAPFISLTDDWDPFFFIELCEQYRDTCMPEEYLCRQIQLAEWKILFDYCYIRAGKV